jgi:hypothetical protein
MGFLDVLGLLEGDPTKGTATIVATVTLPVDHDPQAVVIRLREVIQRDVRVLKSPPPNVAVCVEISMEAWTKGSDAGDVPTEFLQQSVAPCRGIRSPTAAAAHSYLRSGRPLG